MKHRFFAFGLVFLFVVFMAAPKFMVAEGAYLASVLSLGAMLVVISYASAVTATAMQAGKQAKDADDDAVKKSKAINGAVADEPDGVLYRNVDMKHAAITDMFEGDE